LSDVFIFEKIICILKIICIIVERFRCYTFL